MKHINGHIYQKLENAKLQNVQEQTSLFGSLFIDTNWISWSSG